MPNTISNFFAPVRPYDSSAENNFAMYDRMAYTRDLNMCGNDMIKINTGNVLKSYRYYETQPCCVDNSNVPIPANPSPLNGFVETNFATSEELTKEQTEENFSENMETFQESEI